MLAKNNRMIPFIKLLMNHEGYMKSEELCLRLHISARTLRDDIVRFNAIFLQHGLRILSKHGAGYVLEITGEEDYHTFIASLLKEEEDAQRLLPVYPEDRINYLIKLVLRAQDYVKLDDIADTLFISRSTLQHDMKEVRERLRFFHLELDSKPAYGVRLEGNEMHRRSCISQYFFHTETMDDLFTKRNPMDSQQEVIRDILFETLNETNFRLSDIGFQNLIIHISIAMQRTNDRVEEGTPHYEELKGTQEYEVASLLVKRLNAHFQLQLHPIETCYITIHLLGKKTMEYHREYAISEEIEELLHQIFQEIHIQYSYDFFHDFELYMVLALHFQPMLNRLRYGLPMQNPLLKDIKKEHHQAFEMAVLSAEVIQHTLNFAMSEAEMGYLALHYALAMERAEHQQQKKKNIIVVCASGAGSSQILMYKLRQRFKDQIGQTLVIEMYKLKVVKQESYDFILTTVPLPFATKIPVIQVQYFLNGSDVVQLSKAFHDSQELAFIDRYFKSNLFFTDIEGRNKEEVITQMISRIAEHRQIPETLLESVLERERFASTEFGNMVALPHPMKAMSEETFVCVAVLKRPLRWVKQQVRYVFLLCIKKEEQESLQLFHETISSLLMQRSALQEFEKTPDLPTLKRILKQIAQAEAMKDADDIFQ